MKEEKQHAEIELCSDEVQEVMNRIPHWILRSGITVLFFVIIALLFGCWFFKYPDILQAEITVTAENSSAYVLARVPGKLDTLYVNNHQKVSKGSLLGAIVNPALTKDVLWLMKQLHEWQGAGADLPEGKKLFERVNLQLGDMQSVYASFLSTLLGYAHFKELNYYDKKLRNEQRQLEEQKEYYDLVKYQQELAKKGMAVARNVFMRDSILYLGNAMIAAEFDVSQNQYLQQQRDMEAARINLLQAGMQVKQYEVTVLDITKQWLDEELRYQTELKNVVEQLQARLQAYKQLYLLESPIDGRVTFMSVWSQNQNVQEGESLFVIAQDEVLAPVGKALLPIQSSGKVKVGQNVHIRFLNYPENEYGYVRGLVSAISPVPTAEGKYVVEVSFPKGLKTNYGKELSLHLEMRGVADIVLEDMNVLQRLLAPVRKIWMQSLG